MRSGKVKDRQIDSKQAQELVTSTPKALPRSNYGVLKEGQVRDLLGISSISLFALRKTNKIFAAAEQSLQGIMRKHRDKHNVRIHDLSADLAAWQASTNIDLSFHYPVMQTADTNRVKLQDARDLLQHTLIKLQNNIPIFPGNKKQNEAQRLRDKFNHEKDHYEREIANRSSMQKILNQLTMPVSFKQFMFEVNQLSAEHKQELVRLTTVKESLSLRKEWLKTPYEIMFAYDPQREDFTVGIRALYDHDHPHPTVIGGTDPVVRVAGTLDLTLRGEIVKLTKIRNDSGHFHPHNESLEILLRYIKAELNPAYNDDVEVHSVDGNTNMKLQF